MSKYNFINRNKGYNKPSLHYCMSRSCDVYKAVEINDKEYQVKFIATMHPLYSEIYIEYHRPITLRTTDNWFPITLEEFYK